MASSNFVDYVKIYCLSGNGGAGSVHFRREKYIPKGGPDGGDGGKGGDIIMVGNTQMWTLLHLRYERHLRAGHGEPGGGQRSTGADGEDIIIEVPLGTVAKDSETDEVIGEIMEDGERIVLLRGGRGGQGNDHYKSATNQTPRYAQPGEEGKEATIVFELKVLADVGLVGFPNAGKSSLMAAMTRANPKVGAYPFTTLHPNLGVATWHDAKRRAFHVTVADVPGLIEGAHEGKGLGIRFLKHLERTTVLLHLVDVSIMAMDDPVSDFEVIRDEILQYDQKMSQKPFFVAATKIDIVEDSEKLKHLRDYCEGKQIPLFEVSSASGIGVQSLIRTLGLAVVKHRKAQSIVLKSAADEVS